MCENCNSNRPVRVRFAPSPTGYLHVGGARTAIVHPFLPFSAACTCSLAEDPLRVLPVTDSTVTLSFRPFEIVTLRLSRPD